MFPFLVPIISIAFRIGFMFLMLNAVSSVVNSVGDFCSDATAPDTDKKAEAKEKPKTREVGSVSVTPDNESVRVDVAAPGVRAQDLTISAKHNAITIKGESTRGNGEVYKIEREVHVSPYEDVDVDSVTATHADGILTLVIERKPTKTIPVVTAVPVPVVARQHAPESKGPEEPAAAKADTPSDEDNV